MKVHIYFHFIMLSFVDISTGFVFSTTWSFRDPVLRAKWGRRYHIQYTHSNISNYIQKMQHYKRLSVTYHFPRCCDNGSPGLSLSSGHHHLPLVLWGWGAEPCVRPASASSSSAWCWRLLFSHEPVQAAPVRAGERRNQGVGHRSPHGPKATHHTRN